MKVIQWLESVSWKSHFSWNFLSFYLYKLLFYWGRKNKMAKWESRKWIVWHSDFAVLSLEHSTDTTLRQTLTCGTRHRWRAGIWAPSTPSAQENEASGNAHPHPMVCSSSSPWNSGELRWNSPTPGQGQSWVWVGMGSRTGLCSTGQVQDQESPAERLEWSSWNCPKLLFERGPATEAEQKGFEHLVTTRQSNCCYCTGSAFDQFYCLKPSSLWQTLNIPGARAALASPKTLHNTLSYINRKGWTITCIPPSQTHW